MLVLEEHSKTNLNLGSNGETAGTHITWQLSLGETDIRNQPRLKVSNENYFELTNPDHLAFIENMFTLPLKKSCLENTSVYNFIIIFLSFLMISSPSSSSKTSNSPYTC